jgi:hypothetical protein
MAQAHVLQAQRLALHRLEAREIQQTLQSRRAFRSFNVDCQEADHHAYSTSVYSDNHDGDCNIYMTFPLVPLTLFQVWVSLCVGPLLSARNLNLCMAHWLMESFIIIP